MIFDKKLLRECLITAEENVLKVSHEEYDDNDIALSILAHTMLYYHRAMIKGLLEKHKDSRAALEELRECTKEEENTNEIKYATNEEVDAALKRVTKRHAKTIKALADR